MRMPIGRKFKMAAEKYRKMSSSFKVNMWGKTFHRRLQRDEYYDPIPVSKSLLSRKIGRPSSLF